MQGHGLVLGKFMPPHRGHLHLVDFARNFASRVTVVVGSLAAEPIPGELRYRWMRELYPDLEVLHLTDENPQTPDEHPEFWEIWKRSLRGLVGYPVDYVFASETYGERLALELGARFIPCNAYRDLIEVSGTAIRDAPLDHWDFLPPSVQAYYGKRVLLFGPESTGKTTLAGELAKKFGGTLVPEYARTFLQGREEIFGPGDMACIARGQRASEEALARAGRPLLFCDTDPLTSWLWSMELFGEASSDLAPLCEPNPYSLILVLDVDVPWVDGPLRLRPEGREVFLRRCCRELERRGREFLMLSGTWDERRGRAETLVGRLLERGVTPRLP